MDKGWTLIELMSVLAAVSLLGGHAAWRLHHPWAIAQLQGYTQDWGHTVAWAIQQARIHATPWTLCAAQGATCRRDPHWRGQLIARSGSRAPVHLLHLPPTLSMMWSGFPHAHTVTLPGTGWPAYTPNGRWVIRSQQAPACTGQVVINHTGRVRTQLVCSPSDTRHKPP